MQTGDVNPLLPPLLAAADTVARERAEVDADLARELLGEAATLLHNGLALDGLGAADTDSVVAGLRETLVAPDPGAAVRARAEAALTQSGLEDPEAVRAAYLTAVSILQL